MEFGGCIGFFGLDWFFFRDCEDDVRIPLMGEMELRDFVTLCVM
jgi:hypothetical protein